MMGWYDSGCRTKSFVRSVFRPEALKLARPWLKPENDAPGQRITNQSFELLISAHVG